MKNRREPGLGPGLLILALLASCKGSCAGKSNGDVDAAADAAFDDAAITTPDGFAVGVLRDKNVFSVATIASDLTKISFADIGPAHHEASPPQPFLWQNNVYVTWIDSGELRLGRLDGGKVAMIGDEIVDLLTYDAKNPLSDLPAFDVATNGDRGIVVWEQLYPTRGEIHGMPFDKSGFVHAGDGGAAWLTISPPTSDADSPRIAPRADGYWIAWTARAPEPAFDSGVEGPGESPSYRWLEVAALEANGSRVGEPKKLTPPQGHVAGYDVATHGGASEIVLRDAQESSPDEGTTLSRITLTGSTSGVDSIASTGVGRADPIVIGSPAVTWALAPDTNDAMTLFPIAPAKAPASTEPLLKGARPIAMREAGAGVEILAVTLSAAQPGAGEAEIELISCGR